MIKFFIICAWIVFVLTVLFRTEALPTYLRAFRINKLFKFLEVDNYFSQLENSPLKADHYLSYVNDKHDNFFTQLIECPFCLTFWLSIIGAIVLGQWFTFAPIYIVSLMGHFLIGCLFKNSY